MPYVNSSAISWIDYDPGKRRLHIRFTSGPQLYTFYNVPQKIYDEFLRAPSKGRYYHDHIEPFYGTS